MASPLLSYAQAAEQVQVFINSRASFFAQSLPPATLERVPLAHAAGSVLAQTITADRDLPPFPRSTRDGFACRAAEANSHQPLLLAGHIRAGQAHTGALCRGEVWEIMTGAPVPQGADAVFMVEHAQHASDFIRLAAEHTIQPGENIVPQGAEAQAGDSLVPPGTRIHAAQIALAAQCGYSELAVFPRPRIAILSTGDELVRVETTPGPGQIRNSNSAMLAALVIESGAVPILFPSVPDRQRALDRALRQALYPTLAADLLLITGGISTGRFDLVDDALTRAGASFLFRGVAIQPGKPVVFAEVPRPGQPPLAVLALPGNPISSAVTFHLFAAPILAALSGDVGSQPRFALAQLAGNWRGKPGLTRFLPAHCDFGQPPGQIPKVQIIPWQGSGDLAAFARSNCLVEIPAEAAEIHDQSPVQILLT